MNKKVKKMVKKIPDFLVIFSICILLFSLISAYIQRDNPEDCFIFGYKAVYVVSESMEPEIRANALCLTKKIKYEDVKENDIIMFRIDDKLITHRVVSVTDEGIRTKGDNNEMEDAFLLQKENVKSKVVFIWNGFADIMICIAENPQKVIKWSLVSIALIAAFLFGPETVDIARKKVKKE